MEFKRRAAEPRVWADTVACALAHTGSSRPNETNGIQGGTIREMENGWKAEDYWLEKGCGRLATIRWMVTGGASSE